VPVRQRYVTICSLPRYGVLGVPGDGGCGAVCDLLGLLVIVDRFVSELSDGVLGVDGELTPEPLLPLLELLLELPLSEPVPP
jgi:hypothetical protein